MSNKTPTTLIIYYYIMCSKYVVVTNLAFFSIKFPDKILM